MTEIDLEPPDEPAFSGRHRRAAPHNPTVCLDAYAHVMAEQRGGEPVSAEREILIARGQTTGYSQETPVGPQLAGAPECGVVRSTSACRTLSRRTRDMPMS